MVNKHSPQLQEAAPHDRQRASVEKETRGQTPSWLRVIVYLPRERYSDTGLPTPPRGMPGERRRERVLPKRLHQVTTHQATTGRCSRLHRPHRPRDGGCLLPCHWHRCLTRLRLPLRLRPHCHSQRHQPVARLLCCPWSCSGRARPRRRACSEGKREEDALQWVSV